MTRQPSQKPLQIEAHWPVFVINMASNTVRMDKVSTALRSAGIAFERFDAVVGREVSPERLAKVYDAKANRRKFRHALLPGEIGCYLSHVEVWQKLANSDDAGAIVLEDDFAPTDKLKSVLRALSQDDRSWDMVKLFARRDDAKIVDAEDLTEGAKLVKPYQIPNTTLGYAIRREAAQRLLKTSLPFARPIDEDHKRFWENGLDIRAVRPSPLGLNEESELGDTIAATRHKLRGGFSQGLRNLKYRLEYRWNLFAARRLKR